MDNQWSEKVLKLLLSQEVGRREETSLKLSNMDKIHSTVPRMVYILKDTNHFSRVAETDLLFL